MPLPVDDGYPIPVLRLRDGGAHAIESSGTANSNDTAFDASVRVVSVYATADVYLKFSADGSDATSDDHFFPSGVYYDFAIGGGNEVGRERSSIPLLKYLSVLRVTTSGMVYVSEKE